MQKYLFLILLLSSNLFAQVSRTNEGYVPTGAVLSFALNNCPSGFLKADGAAVSRVTYKKLFDLMGTIHGTANGISTFSLPDYRGLFLRMVDGTKGNDLDNASRTSMAAGGASGNLVGSIQSDIFGTHTHIQNAHSHTTTIGGDGSSAAQNAFQRTTNNFGQLGTSSVAATNQNSGGSETRPKNAYVIYCVKY